MWTMVDQSLEHAIKWIIHSVSQEIVIEHGKEEDWAGIHVYLKDIIIVKTKENMRDWWRQTAKLGVNLITRRSIVDAQVGSRDLVVY